MSLFNRIAGFFRAPLIADDPDQAALDDHRCPDCGSEKLIGGPRGGAAQNIACGDCLSEFNVMNFGGVLSLIARMGKLTKERAKLYGMDMGTA